MLDLRFIRENAKLIKQALKNRRDTAPLAEILDPISMPKIISFSIQAL